MASLNKIIVTYITFKYNYKYYSLKYHTHELLVTSLLYAVMYDFQNYLKYNYATTIIIINTLIITVEYKIYNITLLSTSYYSYNINIKIIECSLIY